jgi:hypothetical protein
MPREGTRGAERFDFRFPKELGFGVITHTATVVDGDPDVDWETRR